MEIPFANREREAAKVVNPEHGLGKHAADQFSHKFQSLSFTSRKHMTTKTILIPLDES